MSFIPKAIRRLYDGSARPAFSLCHTTARLPDGWRAAAQAWFDKADHPEMTEHVLVWDQGEMEKIPEKIFERTTFGENPDRKCAVDGWNAAAKLSTGKFLISLSDDLFPCDHWDTELLKVLPDLSGEHVIEVDTGGDQGLLTFSMLTRAYFERLTRDYGYQGGLFYPEYLGMYGDNDFDMLARRDGVVIDAKHLKFDHKHPVYNTAEWDDTYRHQQRPEAYKHGRDVFNKRRRDLGFLPSYNIDGLKKVAFCCPGEQFSAVWVGKFIELWSQLGSKYALCPFFCVSSNVHCARMAISESITKGGEFIDYVLWIDDDNLVTAKQVFQMIETLESNPDIDGVGGWCWCEPDHAGGKHKTSCGAFTLDGLLAHYTAEEMYGGAEDLKRIGFSGFPVFLMRGDVLNKVGHHGFAPILSDKSPWGFWGEDVSFFIRATQLGMKFYVDRRIEVPHLKLRPSQPPSRAVVKKLDAPVTGSERKTA